MNTSFTSTIPVPVLPAREKHKAANRCFQGIPGIAIMSNGRFFACAYSGGTEEGAKNYVMLFVSEDHGKTWSDAVAVVDPPPADVRAFDCTLWVSPKGELCLFWAQSYCAAFAGGIFDGVGGVWISKLLNPDAPCDEFRFSAPRRLAPGIMLNKPLVAKDGSWLLPVSVWQMYSSRPDGMAAYRGACCFRSCDGGESAEFLGRAVIPVDHTFDEHNFIEFSDGRLWCVMRAKVEAMESFSDDGGKTWSEPRRCQFCGFSRNVLRRLASGNLLRVENTLNPDGSTKRRNLTAFLSADDGKTWSPGLLLDARENVSYPDMDQDADGRIYVIYDFNRKRGVVYLTSFTEEDILKGNAPQSPTVISAAQAVNPDYPEA